MSFMGCPCPECTGGMGGMGAMGAMGGVCNDPNCQDYGKPIGDMGGMGPCGNPNCPDCGGGMGGMGGMPGMGGVGEICNDPSCPGYGQPITPTEGTGPCSDPNCPDSGGGGAGTMPPVTYPGLGNVGMPGPGYGGGGGGYPQPPMGPGNSIGQTPASTGKSLNAHCGLICRGMTGQPIDCCTDTGMAPGAQATQAAYRKYWPGQPVDTSQSMQVVGAGGGTASMVGRFMMKIILDLGGEQITVEDHCWLYPNDNCPTELLIGMPFLKKNKMHMPFTERRDFTKIKGRQVPVNMVTKEFYRVWPAGEPAYEGSGKPQYQLGGGVDILPQAAYKVAHHHVGTHGKHLVHAPHGRHSRKSHINPEDRITELTDSDDADDDLQKALAESVKNMASNSRNKRSNQQNKLQKPLPRQTIPTSAVSRAPPNKGSNAKLQDGGRSVKEMARLISGRTAEKARKEEQRKKDIDGFVDEDLDRAIALSLEHIDD